MKLIYLVLFSCLGFFGAFAQDYNTVIKGRFNSTKFQSIRLIHSDILSDDLFIVSKSVIDKEGMFSFKLKLEKPVLCKLFQDLFFVIPNDSINIEAFENPKSPKGYELKVLEGKNSNNYTFYEKFLKEKKEVSSTFFQQPTFSWQSFKDSSSIYFNESLRLLEEARDKNKLSFQFYDYLKQDLYFYYLSSLFIPAYHQKPLPLVELTNYFTGICIDTLINFSPHTDYAAHPQFYQFLKQYFEYVIIPQIEKQGAKSDFSNQFNYVINKFTNDSKEFLVSLIFKKLVLLPDKRYDGIIDTIYSYSKGNFTDTAMLAFVETRYKLHKNLHQKMPTEILATKLVQPNGNLVELKDIIASLKGHNIIIDNWASWCTPCIVAMNDAKKNRASFEEKNVKFIYLSQDASSSAWMRANSKLRLSNANSFLFKDSQNYFLKYFNIASIPHYILLDVNGDLISQKTPTDRNGIVNLVQEFYSK